MEWCADTKTGYDDLEVYTEYGYVFVSSTGRNNVKMAVFSFKWEICNILCRLLLLRLVAVFVGYLCIDNSWDNDSAPLEYKFIFRISKLILQARRSAVHAYHEEHIPLWPNMMKETNCLNVPPV